MKKKMDDEGIETVRRVRQEISAQFDNDPEKLVEHLIQEQEKYKDKIRRPVRSRREGRNEAPEKDS